MSNPIVITRDTVSRPWTEVEPKIFVAIVVGFLAVIALIVAKALGFTLPDEVREAVPLTFALIAGYLTKSTGTTITRYDDSAPTVVEQHTGSSVTTVTASTPIQAPASSSFTQAVEGTSDPNAPTQVMPSSSRVAEFMKGLPPESPLAQPAQSIDDH